ncbi:tyrosine--tRNA ligase [Halocatena salina]|uniref:Tyrosine--tRNA ligase n=1 Tax=Halocatena salina TaxID=2934340 RepID=A0A8U0A2Q1_9EURY|nr:tyrosine--tRNA ligase [Halocatena salina]UPM43136.1 tyrosine--tRNA ligase [Halocatena salina]
MDTAERRALVTRYTEEIVTEEELDELLAREQPTVYIGYAPTGEMHIGHFTTIRKLADFIRAGFDVTVLIADLHAHLDDEKSPFELLDARSRYYRTAIEAMIETAGASADRLTFVRGSEFELDSEYTLELLQMAADTTIKRAQRAGSEVVRQSENPKLGGVLYSLMQSLDVAALEADVAYGGIDQRGIYMLSRELLPKWGYEKPVCAFAPLLSGLSGGKMSASDESSKVGLTDDSEEIQEKLNQAYCPQGETEDNGVLEYVRYLLFPVLEERDKSFHVERPEKFGGDLVYESYEELEADFLSEELHPQDLKNAAASEIAEIVAPVGEALRDDPELLETAYPE